ncbi:hypothetical protein F5Y14DRAFT_446330 [Nemania sp. NC0429]|nr:hypothetical protein F5Y14DRAFT_446330 [Nemania sp. NC0429]
MDNIFEYLLPGSKIMGCKFPAYTGGFGMFDFEAISTSSIQCNGSLWLVCRVADYDEYMLRPVHGATFRTTAYLVPGSLRADNGEVTFNYTNRLTEEEKEEAIELKSCVAFNWLDSAVLKQGIYVVVKANSARPYAECIHIEMEWFPGPWANQVRARGNIQIGPFHPIKNNEERVQCQRILDEITPWKLRQQPIAPLKENNVGWGWGYW